MKGKNFAILFLAILVIFAFTYFSFAGFMIGDLEYRGALNSITKGLDLVGGSVITFEADADSVTSPQMDAAKQVLRRRLDSKGYTEATITKSGAKRLVVEIPAESNPTEAIKLLGQTARLRFLDADGNEVMSSEEVTNAKYQYQAVNQNGQREHTVVLEFSPAGREKFKSATTAAVGMKGQQDASGRAKNYIKINLDETPISQPNVDQTIDSDSCLIHGGFKTAAEAQELAKLIQSGQLPFSLKEVELRSIGPSLGEKALDTSIFAGIIGFIIVVLFMIGFYRLPGFMASVALLAYLAIFAFIMGMFKVNLSLPGIAGIILTIGMAVDANVIIFERIKEEIKFGKTVKAAVDAGFDRALAAIIDSNVTTIIVSVVLFSYGTGPIKGFALTLGIGVIISMITAILITKFLMKRIVALEIRNPKFYAA